MINVMNEYIKLVKNQINEYIKLILENKLDKKISNQYLEAYIYTRYNNSMQKDKTLRTRILEALEQENQNINVLYPEQEKISKITQEIYTYILYLDDVITNKNIDNLIEELYQKKVEILGKENENFKQQFIELLKRCSDEKEKFFTDLESEEFYLKISNYKNANNVQRVNIKHNFKLPVIYSDFAIQKAFNTGITNEDKLFIEYTLISAHVIKEIIRGNYTKQYIIEFSSTLLKKNQKIERILNIINNEAIQDKVSLKIKYEMFENNKDDIYELTKRGFKIAVILDDTFEENYENVQKLDIFSYILINSKLEDYEIIRNSKDLLNKIIEL